MSFETRKIEEISISGSRNQFNTLEDVVSTVHSALPVAPNLEFVIGIATKQVNLTLFVSDSAEIAGLADPARAKLLDAVMRFLPQGVPVRCLGIANDDLRRRLGIFRDKAGSDPCVFLDLRSQTDSAIEQLARALLRIDEMDEHFREVYANAVGLAIAARLLGHGHRYDPFRPKRNCGALPRWRLKRALEYIDANLAEPITLGDLAAVTGLSSMHFAAQFRISTGIRPHEYLLRRRIERARDLLLQHDLSIADIALSVGFQTQSHFTTVFKRFVGDAPHQWRRSNYTETDHVPAKRSPRSRETTILGSHLALQRSQSLPLAHRQ
ncbi:AraC family transcriptional regulator [Mesorhizobium sp. M1066]|uniref:AraC family transcriptional regulator n=1 Tax=unclassified Mesorhizobium TaxID=325217 RepID=UPI003337CA74